jgi:hypothetical protein
MDSNYRPGFIEKFGIFYLKVFQKRTVTRDRIPTDEYLIAAVKKISVLAIMASGIIGIACVFPMVWVDVHYSEAPWYVHYGWLALITLIGTILEFYLLFLVSLKSVHEVAELVNIRATNKEYNLEGPFSIINILSRTALEMAEPEISLFGINPFKQVSKRNLLLLGILYKLKIIVTNIIL